MHIYSASHFESEDRALLHAAAFEECVQYHTGSKFNESVKAKSIKVSPTPGHQATEQDISERMDRGFVTEPQAEQTASHGAFKSAGLQPPVTFSKAWWRLQQTRAPGLQGYGRRWNSRQQASLLSGAWSGQGLG